MSRVMLVKDVAKVTNGKSDVKDVVENGEYVFFDRSTSLKRSDKFLFDREAIIIPGEDSREIFEPRYYTGKFDLHQRCYAIYDFSHDVYPKYLFYKLKTLTKHFANVYVGSTVPSLRMDHIADLKVDLPAYDLQKKAARILSSLDYKIELNRKINAELEQMARTLYDYWFVQFDFPDANGKPYKSSGGAMKFSPELNREIPEGWQVQNMLESDLFEVIKPRIDDFNGEKQYIATADVNGLNISDGSPITYENRESRANMQPKAFTVWFAKMKNSIKHVLVGDYSNDLIEKTIFSTGFMGLQTKREAFEYVALTVHRPYFELVKDSNSSGATMEAIGNSVMANMKLIIPDEKTLKKFHKIVRPLLEKIDKNRQQSQNLAHLRDWLLPMLMNGQVRVD